MLELLIEILALIVLVRYFYKDYQKAKLEGQNLQDNIRSYVKGFVIFIVILNFVEIVFGLKGETEEHDYDF